MSSSEPATSSAVSPLTRRAFHGSCHCGHIRYATYLTLPTNSIHPPSKPPGTCEIYKCNCVTCRKMGLFHVRPLNPPLDFQLISPLNPTTGGLVDYTCFKKRNHWWFCPTCGVRCFGFAGEGEVRVEKVDGKEIEVWGFKVKEWEEAPYKYLTVNAITLEPGQEGLDLKEWTEKGWIRYLDLNGSLDQIGVPNPGGMY